jgi:hypothetical protein
MNVEVILLLATVVIIGTVLIAVLSLTNKGKRLDVEKYRTRWLAIEQSLVRNNEASYHLAVMNGDKLVDSAMRDLGMGGKTMGDRLKLAKNRFSDRNSIWEAHKLRNKIAHEADVRVSYDQARRALAGFKRALKDLGAI